MIQDIISKLENGSEISDEEVIVCIGTISQSSKNDVVNFYYYLLKKLTNEIQMNMIREHCTPFLVKAVYF